jgi:hypothetical protein
MTERQLIAIGSPCARAIQTIRPAYARLEHDGARVFTTILTINK